MGKPPVQKFTILFPLQIYSKKIDQTFFTALFEQVILSKIPFLGSDLVGQLETAEVYDVKDFLDLDRVKSKDFFDNSVDITRLKSEVMKYAIDYAKYPSLILDLPHNYGFLDIDSDDENYYLGIYWRGLLNIFTDKRENGWLNLKNIYFDFLDKSRSPEMITLKLFELPNWLQDVTFYEIYLKTINLIKLNEASESVVKSIERQYPDGIHVIFNLIKLAYTFNLCSILRNKRLISTLLSPKPRF